MTCTSRRCIFSLISFTFLFDDAVIRISFTFQTDGAVILLPDSAVRLLPDGAVVICLMVR
jgi:hypothetical protein